MVAKPLVTKIDSGIIYLFILISAKNHLRIDKLLESIKEIIDKGFTTADVHFSFEQAKETAEAQNGVTVLEREYDEDGVRLKIRGSVKRINQIIGNQG